MLDWKETDWYKAIAVRRGLAQEMLTLNPHVSLRMLAWVLQCSKQAAYVWKKRLAERTG